MKSSFKSNLWILAALCFICTGLFAFSPVQKQSWDVPAKYKNKKCPIKVNDKNLAAAKIIWTKNCVPCHGDNGLGDGPSASRLKIDFKSFSSEVFQSQSDGEIYYKIITGKGFMPPCKNKRSNNENWLIVNYLRTLK